MLEHIKLIIKIVQLNICFIKLLKLFSIKICFRPDLNIEDSSNNKLKV